MGPVGEVHERRPGRDAHRLDEAVLTHHDGRRDGSAPRGGPWSMIVACHPVANCSERTRVAGRAVVTRMVSSPHGVLDTTWAGPWCRTLHPGAPGRRLGEDAEAPDHAGEAPPVGDSRRRAASRRRGRCPGPRCAPPRRRSRPRRVDAVLPRHRLEDDAAGGGGRRGPDHGGAGPGGGRGRPDPAWSDVRRARAAPPATTPTRRRTGTVTEVTESTVPKYWVRGRLDRSSSDVRRGRRGLVITRRRGRRGRGVGRCARRGPHRGDGGAPRATCSAGSPAGPRPGGRSTPAP